MLEQCQKYLDESTRNFAKDSIRTRYCLPIGELDRIDQHYDVVWIQWVVGHIDDEQFAWMLH